MGQTELALEVSPATPSLAEEFLAMDAQWRCYGTGNEKGEAALRLANDLLMRATKDDLWLIAQQNPWRLSWRKALRNVRVRQKILSAIHFGRSQQNRPTQILER